MPVSTRRAFGSSGLTFAQAHLLERHRRGLIRLAHLLAERTRGLAATDIMFVLAHSKSTMAEALCRATENHRSAEIVVFPGQATELSVWIERLALDGPVHDCTTMDAGISVLLIDEHGRKALVRIPEGPTR